MTEFLEVRLYKKRPLTVEAVKVTLENLALVAAWCNGEEGYQFEKNLFDAGGIYRKVFRCGLEIAEIGDYIVKEGDTEFHVRVEQSFTKTHDAVFKLGS